MEKDGLASLHVYTEAFVYLMWMLSQLHWFLSHNQESKRSDEVATKD